MSYRFNYIAVYLIVAVIIVGDNFVIDNTRKNIMSLLHSMFCAG